MIATQVKYKKTGIDWMPEVLEHWEVVRLKNIVQINGSNLSEQTNKNALINYIDITNVNGDGDILEVQQIKFKDSPSRARRVLKKNDTIISTVRTYLKAITAIREDDFISSTGFAVLTPDISKLNPDYLYYYVSSKVFVNKVMVNSVGVAYPAITPTTLACLPFILPPIDEQNNIVDILNSESVKIAHFIQTKQRFIELLKEQRQNIITNAVTKGIDEMAKMKETGIEWMPQIPEHWDIRRLRYVGQCQNGLNKGAEYFGTGFPFISYIDVYKNESLPFHVNGLAVSSEEDRINYSVVEGDIFFTRTSETVDEIGFSSVCLSTIPNATFSGFLIRFRPNRNFLFAGFSKYFFRCKVHRAFFVKEMLLVTRASLSQNLLKNLPVLLPPIEEQKQIANFIEAETRILDIAISKAEREIELIKEYREAMIAEAVTGKRK